MMISKFLEMAIFSILKNNLGKKFYSTSGVLNPEFGAICFDLRSVCLVNFHRAKNTK